MGEYKEVKDPTAPLGEGEPEPTPVEGDVAYKGYFSQDATRARERAKKMGLEVLPGGGETDPHANHPSRKSDRPDGAA